MNTEGTDTKEKMAEKEGELGGKEGTQNGENGKEKWSEKEEWHDTERSDAEEVLSFDEVLVRHVGQCGRYQIGVCLLLSLVAISNAFYIMDVVFVTAAPASYRCDISKNGILMSLEVGQTLNVTSSKVGQSLNVTSSKVGHKHAMTSTEASQTLNVTLSKAGQTPALTSSGEGRALGPVRQCVVRNANLSSSGDQEGNGTLWGHGVTCTKWTYEDGPFKDSIVKQVSHFTQSRGSGWG